MEALAHKSHRLSPARYTFSHCLPQPIQNFPPTPFLHEFVPQAHPTLLQHYLSYYSEPLAPLDLSLKNSAPITPPCTPPPRKNEKENKKVNKIIRHFEEDDCHTKDADEVPEANINDAIAVQTEITEESPEAKKLKFSKDFFEDLKSCLPSKDTDEQESSDLDVVEVKSVQDKPKKKDRSNHGTKKSKAVRKLVFDEDKTSPVSGTIIRDLDEDETLVVRKGDIDPAFNVVEVTEEAKASLASIENKLGRYICRLCRRLYSDAFGLAQHRCSRIVHIEYRCPECDKVFNCPANLASHRRWHKPRAAHAAKASKRAAERSGSQEADDPDGNRFFCKICGKLFRRQAYLRKHYMAHETLDSKQPPQTERILSTEPSNLSVADKTSESYDAKNQSEYHEVSAFRQVHSKYKHIASYEPVEMARDTDYNTFWNKIHTSSDEFVNPINLYPFFDRNGRGDPNAQILNNRPNIGAYAVSCVSSVLSEDSRTLDITGSEDETNMDTEGVNVNGVWEGNMPSSSMDIEEHRSN